MAQSPVRPRAPVPQRRSERPVTRPARRAPRFWYLPLLLAILLPLLSWAALNIAAVVVAQQDLGAAAQPAATATLAPDQALLNAAIALVQTTPCQTGGATVAAQPAYAPARWSARRSEADSHAYYVAATDAETDRLLGVWQVEGGAAQRLLDTACPGLPAGQPAQLAEAAALFSPHQATGQ